MRLGLDLVFLFYEFIIIIDRFFEVVPWSVKIISRMDALVRNQKSESNVLVPALLQQALLVVRIVKKKTLSS